LSADRGRGGHGGQHQRRRDHDRPQHRRPGAGGYRLPRPTRRNWRFIPSSRGHGGQRRSIGGGRHEKKTHPRDYENAITENTAAILRVHPSNYKITGFTAEVPPEELARIAHARGIIMIDDVGAGALIDLRAYGFPDQPTLQESLRAGADLVLASTDKLIGGPQGGIILGRADLVAAIRKNPLARVVRVDKMTLAALEATLSLFLDQEQVFCRVPTLRLLRRELSEIGGLAERIAEALRGGEVRATVAVIDGASQMGSGSLPGENLQTKLVAIRCGQLGPDALAERLRRHEPPIFARIARDQVLIDPRTLLDGEAEVVVQALLEILPRGGCC